MSDVIKLSFVAKRYFLSPLSRNALLRASDINANPGFLTAGDGARARFHSCSHKMRGEPNPPSGPLGEPVAEPLPEFRLCA